MTDSIIFTSLETEGAQTAVVPVFGRNFATTSGSQSSVVTVAANGTARINGSLRIGGTSTVSVISSQPAAQVTKGIAGTGAVSVASAGNARVNGEIFERGTSVVSVYSEPAKFAAANGETSFEPLISVGAEYPYVFGETDLSALQSSGDEIDFELSYAIAETEFSQLLSTGFGLLGVQGDGDTSFEPLISIGSSYPYAFGDTAFAPLDPLGYEVIFFSTGGTLFQTQSVVDGNGRVVTVDNTIIRPESRVEGLSAWDAIVLRQPASELEVEATNPPVGRALLTQGESIIDATGLTGAVGGAALDQPKSKLSASDSWKVQLEQPSTGIDATGLTGRISKPGPGLDQPKSAIEGEGTIFSLGRADLTQPKSELVQAIDVFLDQPESVLSAIGLSAPSEETGRAFAVNYENAAVTEYDTFPFAAIAEFNGSYYAVGPEGVYRLNPHSGDNGAAIHSEVRFAEQEQGGQRRRGHLTKITYLYFFVDGKEPFDAILTTGEGHERKYRVQQRDGDNVHTRRVTAGKGVKARSWGLGFIHEGTDHFRLYDVEMVGEVLQRKV